MPDAGPDRRDLLGDPPLPYARLDHTHSINIETGDDPAPAAPDPFRVWLHGVGLVAVVLAVIIEAALIAYLALALWRGWP